MTILDQSVRTSVGRPSAICTSTWRRPSRTCRFYFPLSRTAHEYATDGSCSFEKLEVTKVNTYGIVLRWQGSDEALRPVLITAHQGEEGRPVSCAHIQSFHCRRCACRARHARRVDPSALLWPFRWSVTIFLLSGVVILMLMIALQANGYGVEAPVTTSRMSLRLCRFFSHL